MTDCPLYLNAKEIGRLRWSQEGENIVLWASCPFEQEYIYRLYVGNRADNTKLYLGIMMPERERFVISKKIPLSKCSFLMEGDDITAQINRRLPGEEEKTPPLPFAFSRFEPVKGAETGCGQFIEDIFAACGGLYARFEGTTYFSAPWEPGEELGPSSFFCLLTYFKYKNKGYCVLCVDSKGKLFSLEQSI